ncbi:Hypothetical protein NTJ_13224 [Nesidiocoris tenuis]|uniref:Uncharacterized protein n=1 Tax=Nesidiocoris tenuis TaxID=355587 RepID=A0ABN7B9W0_9HEMI|nr:Hypothetical protein NTJ_13224 [Nesidiocoris tenuis]
MAWANLWHPKVRGSIAEIAGPTCLGRQGGGVRVFGLPWQPLSAHAPHAPEEPPPLGSRDPRPPSPYSRIYDPATARPEATPRNSPCPSPYTNPIRRSSTYPKCLVI